MPRPSPLLSSPAIPAIDNRLIVVEAIWRLGLAWLAIRLLPFSFIVAPRRTVGRTDEPVINTRRLARAVEIARRKVPWRAKCFESSIALRAMLRRRGVPCVLHYGLGSEKGAVLRAHVWLSVADQVVIGGVEARDFVQVAKFPSEVDA